MKLGKTLLVLLAIFCVVVSAGAVCAEGDDGGEGGWAGSNYVDDGEGQGQASGEPEPGNGLPLENQTANATATGSAGENVTGNATGNATGNVTNTTGNATNATGNATNFQSMLSTGLPIAILVVVVAIVGGYVVLKRKD